MEALFSELEAAFTYFGSAPQELLLFDQMRAVVNDDESGHERGERSALKPLALQPFPQLGAPSHDRRRRLAVRPLVVVERRPLSAYAEAVR